MASGSGYETKSLYERGKEMKDDDPYEYDPYDDDDVEYNSHNLSEDQSAVCDAWDIKIHERQQHKQFTILLDFGRVLLGKTGYGGFWPGWRVSASLELPELSLVDGNWLVLKDTEDHSVSTNLHLLWIGNPNWEEIG
nr:hypothetical protein [Tanacetum cinerariifolium]